VLFAVNKSPTRSDLRKFGLTVLVGFAVIGGLAWWVKGWTVAAIALWAAGIAVWTVATLSASAGTKIYVVWMSIGAAIGRVVMPIFFTLAFFTILPLFSLIRFTDPLRLKLKRDGTYWLAHKHHEATIERMLRPF